MTKPAFLIASAVALFLANAGRAADPSDPHLAAAQDLLLAMNLDKTFEQSIDQMLALQVQQRPELAAFKDVMSRFLHKHMSWEAIKGDMAKIYVDEFTEAELKEIANFYRTPTGKKAAEKLPVLMTKGAQIGMKRVQTNMPELQQMIRDEVERKRQAAEPGETPLPE